MKKVIILSISLLFILLTACGKEEKKEFVINVDTPISDEITIDTDTIGTDLLVDGTKKVTLKECIDGDTAYFTTGVYKDGELMEKVRFMGVDTPETHHPTKGVEPFGNAASQFTCKVLTDAEEIILQLDNGDEHFDEYGRLLAYVWVDGKLLNSQLVELGLSQTSITSKSKYYDSIMAAYFSARKKELGVNGYELDPNWDYEKDKSKECSQYTCVIDKSYKYKFSFPEN